MVTAPLVYGPTAEPAAIRQYLASGALGYVLKTEGARHLLTAVEHAQRGQTYLNPGATRALIDASRRGDAAPRLSKQESRVLTLYASGMPLRRVADSLNIGYETAKSYLPRVRVKYSDAGRVANSKIDLRSRAMKDGLLAY
jgi:DNA-binding NarL/FixJ family response regulator